jgi:hypothetical protein
VHQAAQAAAAGPARRLGPEQGGQRVATNRARFEREVGEQREAALQLQGQRHAVAAHAGVAVQGQRQGRVGVEVHGVIVLRSSAAVGEAR